MADVKHGRRAREGDDRPAAGWGDATAANEREVRDLPTLEAGVDEGMANAPRVEEDMSREVADAPADYHTAMPKISELTTGSRWSKVLRATDVDLSILVSTLATTLDDEDVPWNPETLLVQLNSELLDAADKRVDDEGTTSPTAASAKEAKDQQVTSPDARRSRRK